MATDNSYTIGHKESALEYMQFRTAERCCAFFREHVRPAEDEAAANGSTLVGRSEIGAWARV